MTMKGILCRAQPDIDKNAFQYSFWTESDKPDNLGWKKQTENWLRYYCHGFKLMDLKGDSLSVPARHLKNRTAVKFWTQPDSD
jgi:hypothetical protein